MTELVIVEERSKDRSGKDTEVWFVRDRPYREGFSINATALNYEGAVWLRDQILASRAVRPDSQTDSTGAVESQT